MKSGIVLAGGKSSRFGTNKALVQFHGKPLVKWVIEPMGKVVDEIILSLSSEPDIPNFVETIGIDIKMVKDVHPGLGPISGLLSSFKEAKGEYVAVAPCDSPFIKPELYELLFEKAKGYDGAVPFINNFWEPIHAVYKRKTFITAMEEALHEGKKRPADTYPYLNIQKVTQDEIKVVDPEAISFFNINTVDDLKKGAKIMENLRPKSP